MESEQARFRRGDRLWARDKFNLWWEACVVKERDKGGDLELRIHFKGWSAGHKVKEWIGAFSFGLQSEQPPPDAELADAEDEDENERLFRNLTGHVGDDQFEVEHIVGRRVRNGAVQYKVKWKNWAAKWNQWRDAVNIDAGLVADLCTQLLIDVFLFRVVARDFYLYI